MRRLPWKLAGGPEVPRAPRVSRAGSRPPSTPWTRGPLRGVLPGDPQSLGGPPVSNTTQVLSAPARPQVKSVNLSEGELLSIRGVDGPSLTVLANHTLLVEGQVIRSPTNTISVYFRTFQDDGLGTFQLHYQGKAGPGLLRCTFGLRSPPAPRTASLFVPVCNTVDPFLDSRFLL